MDNKEREAALDELDKKYKTLKIQREEAKASGKSEQIESIDRQIEVIKNQTKHHLFKLGKYRYPDDEEIQIGPGQYINANLFHWMRD